LRKIKIIIKRKRKRKRKAEWLGMVVHTFNPSTREAEAGRFLSLRPAWSTE
jgi:major histocompatibility complex class I